MGFDQYNEPPDEHPTEDGEAQDRRSRGGSDPLGIGGREGASR